MRAGPRRTGKPGRKWRVQVIKVHLDHIERRRYATVRLGYDQYRGTGHLFRLDFRRLRFLWKEMADLYEAEVKQRSNPVQIFLYGFGAGILICVLAVILIQKQKKDGG